MLDAKYMQACYNRQKKLRDILQQVFLQLTEWKIIWSAYK